MTAKSLPMAQIVRFIGKMKNKLAMLWCKCSFIQNHVDYCYYYWLDCTLINRLRSVREPFQHCKAPTTQQLHPHNSKFALIMCALRKFIDSRNDLERNELKWVQTLKKRICIKFWCISDSILIIFFCNLQ